MLNTILHRQDEAPMLLFEKIKYRLEEKSFEPRDYDPCMFVSDKVICLVQLLFFQFYWPPAYEVCLNYQMLIFQSWKGTSLDLYSVDNCYVAVHLIHVPPFMPTNQYPPEKATCSCPFSIYLYERLFPKQDHLITQELPVSVLAYQDYQLPKFNYATYPPSPTSQHLPYSHFRFLKAAEISAIIYLSCLRATVLCHKVSQHLPPPSFPFTPQ